VIAFGKMRRHAPLTSALSRQNAVPSADTAAAFFTTSPAHVHHFSTMLKNMKIIFTRYDAATAMPPGALISAADIFQQVAMFTLRRVAARARS